MWNNFLDKLRNVHRSWTIWFNTGLALTVANLPLAAEQFPQLQTYLPDNIFKAAMMVLVAGNILLRFKTNKPLSEK